MRRLWLVALLPVVAGCFYIGQQSNDPDSNPSPAETPWGELSFMEGSVSIRLAAGDTWAIPDTNVVLGSGDRLWVDSVGHLEVEFGSTTVRLASETELDLVTVDTTEMQFLLPQGSIDYRLREIDTTKSYEVDAPNAAIFLEENGEYRIDVSTNGDTTRLVTWSGHAQVTAAGRTFPVDSGQMVYVRGDSTTGNQIVSAGPMDAFDLWSRDRNAREEDTGPMEDEKTDANSP
jgi:hypothetical protein